MLSYFAEKNTKSKFTNDLPRVRKQVNGGPDTNLGLMKQRQPYKRQQES